MVLTPSVFVSEPPHIGRTISSPTQAFVGGLLILIATALAYRAKYRWALAHHPAVTLTPEGMYLAAADTTKRLAWPSVLETEVQWKDGAETLTVRTESETFEVPHTRVSADLKRVAEAIAVYRAAHAPEASGA